MYRNRILIGLALAVLVGLVASTFVYRQMRQASTPRPMATTKLVVAATALPLGTRLEPQFLREVPWSGGDPLPGMFTSVADVAERALITSVVENEPILETKLAPKEAGAGLAAVIPEGKRAMSVKVDEVVGVAGFVLPSTMVDVLVTGSVGGRGASSDSITRVILENIRVLTAGQQVEEDKDGKPKKVNVVTLLVTPEEAGKLAMASTEGRIQLALRNTIDGKLVQPPVIHRANIFSGGAPVAPRRVGPRAEPPPPAYVVEIIRGDKRENKTFAQ